MLITIVSLLALLVLIVAGLLSIPRYRNMISKVFPFLTVTPEITNPTPPSAYVAPQRDLTADEKEALDVPLHSATVEEKKQYAVEVAKLAKTAPALDVTGCKPEPLVYKVDLKGSFKIINRDAIPHTVRYLSTQTVVPAHGTTTVKTSQLFSKAGDYGYGCDNPFAKMGVFMVR